MIERRTFTSPGRVNLIGEHTDYTGGFVLPIAIPFETSIDVRPTDGGEYSFSSTLFQSGRSIRTDEVPVPSGEWSDYPLGVLAQFLQEGIRPPAFHAEISGNVPLGSGLSSSASVEVATAVALLSLAQQKLNMESIALLCQRAENTFVGSPCGIMDQFASAAARAERALLLNTRSLEYEHLPLDRGTLKNCSWVIVNSMVKHSIAEGEYGKRRREVEMGQEAPRETFANVTDLADASINQLESLHLEISPEALRRCRHIISENGRVLQACDALNAGDAGLFGRLING